jgi:hypothetical protein
LVDLHHDETTTNDKWSTLKAISKLIYSRFDFDDGIYFTICVLKKGANEVGPLWSKISQGNHTIVRSPMELRRKDFVNVAKTNIECEPGNVAFWIGRNVLLLPPLVESTLHAYSMQPAYTFHPTGSHP